MIEARLLTKVFRDRKKGDIRGADEVSFKVDPGTIYGLLGANGAGKTTTLRMLATLLKPTSGTAVVAGHDVAREPGKVRACVGFLGTTTAPEPGTLVLLGAGLALTALAARRKASRADLR